MTSMESL